MATILDSETVLARGVRALVGRDPVLRRLVAAGARPALRKRAPGFEGLARIIVAQQLSTASADAIWARLAAQFPNISPAGIAAAEDATLRAAGLSAAKIRTLRAVAAAVSEGGLPLDGLGRLGVDEAHARLTAVKGIGPWTADVYLLFCLGHPDAFPAGDLAVQEAARLAYGLRARPTGKEFIALAEAWRPWRGVAAKILWAHYRIAKQGEGAPASATLTSRT